jgi:uncharacterized membrane protein
MPGSVFLVALLFGVIAGLRTFTAPAVVAWAAELGRLHLAGSWLAFLGSAWARWVFTALALGELVGDQLPFTPSRTVPMQFGARLVSGALSGAAVGAAAGHTLPCAVAGIVGAVVGTLVGARARAGLARAFHNDHPAAFVEDAVAVGGAVLIGMAGR